MSFKGEEEVSGSGRKTGKSNAVCVMKAGAATGKRKGPARRMEQRQRRTRWQIRTRHDFRCMHENGTMKAISLYAKLKVNFKKNKNLETARMPLSSKWDHCTMEHYSTEMGPTHTHRTQVDIKGIMLSKIIPLIGLSP